MMSLSEKESGKLGFSEDRVQPFRPLDRNEFSEIALLLLDRYRVDDANDPMAIFVSIVDKMSAHQREVISRFEGRRLRWPREWSLVALIWPSERPRKRRGMSRPWSPLSIRRKRISPSPRTRSGNEAIPTSSLIICSPASTAYSARFLRSWPFSSAFI